METILSTWDCKTHWQVGKKTVSGSEEGCELKKKCKISCNNLKVILLARIHRPMLKSKTEAGKIEWEQIMLILIGHVELFDFSPKTNEKAPKDFKLWNNMIIFALNILG